MFAPPPPVVLNAQAVSGILGSISIACWVIVFAPQIYENFCRKSAEGLSLLFVVLWLIGDVFNVIGSIAQNVLPTMLILAIYYTLADVVLLAQCLMYGTNENVDPIHLSPANPLSEDVLDEIIAHQDHHHHHHHNHYSETDRLIGNDQPHRHAYDEESSQNQQLITDSENQSQKSSSSNSNVSKFRSEVTNGLLVALVLVSGIGGWYISYIRSANHDVNTPPDHHHDQDNLEIDFWGQVFGYLCAVFYLGSRVPQILLNYRRKSCDGISFMFFFFACMGNLTYVLSILCVGVSKRYIVINFSWLLGSVGALALDAVIFVQFFIYNDDGAYDTLDDQDEYP